MKEIEKPPEFRSTGPCDPCAHKTEKNTLTEPFSMERESILLGRFLDASNILDYILHFAIAAYERKTSSEISLVFLQLNRYLLFSLLLYIFKKSSKGNTKELFTLSDQLS